MFTNSPSSYGFIQNLQNGKFDRHCLALSVLETIAFSALAIAFSCGMIGCSTAATTPCTGASCQNLAKADGGASGSDGAASDDASNGGETGKKSEVSSQFPEFKNSVPQMCDFSNPPPGLECMNCKWDENHELQGCGYKELNSPAGNKCTKNPWILKAPGEWKLAVNMIGDECCGYAQACGYGNKPPCDSESVTPKSPRRFVVACIWAIDASSDKTTLTECPDGFIFREFGYSGNKICILEDGTAFSTGVKGVEVTKGKLWWKDGALYAGFCKYSNFVDASKEYPCHYSDGSVASDKYRILQKISN